MAISFRFRKTILLYRVKIDNKKFANYTDLFYIHS